MELEVERESKLNDQNCGLRDLFNYTEKVVEEKVREERRKLDEEMRI